MFHASRPRRIRAALGPRAAEDSAGLPTVRHPDPGRTLAFPVPLRGIYNARHLGAMSGRLILSFLCSRPWPS